MTAVPNQQFGVFVNDSPNLKITGNVISANGVAGIDILDVASKGIVVKGNSIGPNILGQPAFRTPLGTTVQTSNGPVLPGVQRYGVAIIGASNNVIGDTTSRTSPRGTGNFIIGNGQVGVYVTNTDFNGKVYARPTGSKIENNTISTSGLYGILFYNAPNNQAPPVTGPGSRNVFHKNRISFLNYVKAINGLAPLPIPKHSKPHFPTTPKTAHHNKPGVRLTSEHPRALGPVRVKAPTLFSTRAH